MKEVLEVWQKNRFMKREGEHLLFEKKRVFVEGQRARENAGIVDKYKKAARSSDGAVLFAVFRGRNAEGSNFPHKEARGIFNVGLPYADYHDPLVRAHRNNYVFDIMNHVCLTSLERVVVLQSLGTLNSKEAQRGNTSSWPGCLKIRKWLLHVVPPDFIGAVTAISLITSFPWGSLTSFTSRHTYSEFSIFEISSGLRINKLSASKI